MPVKIALSLGLITVAIVGVFLLLELGGPDREAQYDWIVAELVEKGHYREAVDELEALRGGASPHLASRIEQQLVRAYIGVGEDPSLSVEEGVRWFGRAYEIDPDALAPLQRRLVEQQQDE